MNWFDNQLLLSSLVDDNALDKEFEGAIKTDQILPRFNKRKIHLSNPQEQKLQNLLYTQHFFEKEWYTGLWGAPEDDPQEYGQISEL